MKLTRLVIVAICSLVFFISCELNDEHIKYENGSDNRKMANRIQCPDEFDFDSLFFSNAAAVKLNHSYPGLLESLNYKYKIDTNVTKSIKTVDHIITDSFGHTYLKFHSVDGELKVIEKRIIRKDYSLRPLLFDSIYLLEYYYFSALCCVREQFSYGCANKGNMSIENSPCEIERDRMNEIIAEKNAANNAPPSTRR